MRWTSEKNEKVQDSFFWENRMELYLCIPIISWSSSYLPLHGFDNCQISSTSSNSMAQILTILNHGLPKPSYLKLSIIIVRGKRFSKSSVNLNRRIKSHLEVGRGITYPILTRSVILKWRLYQRQVDIPNE
jgi:hypothetical protein